MELTYKNIHFVPIVHQRVTFAEAVRRHALAVRPDVIAVELPASLEPWIVRGTARLPQLSAVCHEDASQPGELALLPIDPCDGLIEAVRTGLANHIPLAFIDLDLPGLHEPWRYVPDDLIIDQTGLGKWVEELAPFLQTSPDDAPSRAREAHMARRLRQLAEDHNQVLCVLGVGHYLHVRALLEGGEIPGEEPTDDAPDRPDAFLAHLTTDSLTDVLREIPYVAHLYEQQHAEQELTGESGFDKLLAVQSILKQAERTYTETYKTTINVTQWRTMLQYTRNLAMVAGRLRPDLYEVIMGARGCVDGDYGYEVYELARSYPPQKDNHGDLPRLRVFSGRAAVEGRDEKFRLLSRWEGPDTKTVSIGFRRRPSRQLKARWQEDWEKSFHMGICSWPPEDAIQEKFMDFLRKRALQQVTEEHKQVDEFKTSMLDGLDIRETMRNWHTGKLYVQSTPQPHGRVGAVVLIFEDEPLDLEGSWRTTLYAENQNESDISFFATPLGGNVVGPRICRTEFGGILSIFPAPGVPDIWSFAMGGDLQWSSEALMVAATLFSTDRYIAYVAPKPPSEMIKGMVASAGKRLIYLPLHSFSPGHLRRVRRFHILDGRDVRAWARDYIYED